MHLLGIYSNQDLQGSLSRLAEKLAAVRASGGPPRWPVSRRQRPRRPGWVIEAIVQVLANRRVPMQIRDIHAAVEALVGEPVPPLRSRARSPSTWRAPCRDLFGWRRGATPWRASRNPGSRVARDMDDCCSDSPCSGSCGCRDAEDEVGKSRQDAGRDADQEDADTSREVAPDAGCNGFDGGFSDLDGGGAHKPDATLSASLFKSNRSRSRCGRNSLGSGVL